MDVICGKFLEFVCYKRAMCFHFLCMQPGLMSERVIMHGSPVPIENQRMIQPQGEKNTGQGNPSYERF